MRSYTDKTVYLGIDVHKKTYSVTAVCEGQIAKKDTLTAEPARLINYCKKYFPGAQIHTAYETGFCGFYLHRRLEENGIKNSVIHAAGIEIAVGDKVKTDKRDSLKLATQLSVGRLKGVHVPSKEREDYRALTRARETFVRHRTRIGCQLKALLFQHGMIPFDHDKPTSEKWIRSLQAELMSDDLRFVVDEFCEMWLHITSKIKKIEAKMAVQAEADGFLEAVYRSVPGIGAVGARALANELGDTLRFNNERQLFSYVGLTPSEHSSGGHIRQGHITRQGNSLIRKILVQAAWKAIKHDPSLQKIYDRIALRAGGKRAIVGIARRMVGRIRSCFRTGTLYKIAEEENCIESSVEV
jgi:transposase